VVDHFIESSAGICLRDSWVESDGVDNDVTHITARLEGESLMQHASADRDAPYCWWRDGVSLSPPNGDRSRWDLNCRRFSGALGSWAQENLAAQAILRARNGGAAKMVT
jgi:hypothetical protein